MVDGGHPSGAGAGRTGFAKVVAMSEQQYRDPSGNTEQFKAFVRSPEPEPQRSLPVGLIAGVVAAIVVIGVIAWLALT
jgi:hypothetical protein